MTRGRLAGAVLGALLFAGVLGGPAQAKSFEIESVLVEARLNPDASMDVIEHITYDFDGEFHNGTRPIPPGEYEIVEMRVTDERGAAVPYEGSPYNLTFHYDALDERRTFTIAYKVLRAAKVGPDVGELYWKWVGADTPGVGAVRVLLATPGGVVPQAWAHGPLNGVVAPTAGGVTFNVSNLPAGQFVEGRVAVPAAAFSVPPAGPPRLPTILAEEQRYVDVANAERTRARLLNGTLWIVPLLGWLFWLYLYRRFGREPATPVDDVEYVREPLDDPPAVVDALLAWGTPDGKAFAATVVDLAQRGALTIEEERTDRRFLPDTVDWRFTQKGQLTDLKPYEAEVLARLFAAGPVTTQSEQVKWANDHQSSARAFWTGFLEEVKNDYEARNYQQKRAGVIALNVLAVAAVGGIAILGMAAGLDPTIGVVSIIAAVIQGLGSIPLRQRTSHGAQRAASWRAFSRFLKDFSRLGDAPVGHLALWERYLVYSVALGISDEVAKGLAMKVPPEQRSHFATWYGGGVCGNGNGGGPSMTDSFSTFVSSFGSSIGTAMAPSSSSSGGGGGFSGGGGGGGGGGGIGAS